MKIKEALQQIKSIRINNNARPVWHTVAEELQSLTGAVVSEDGAFRLGPDEQQEGVFLRLGPDGTGALSAGNDRFVYGFFARLLNGLADQPVDFVASGRSFPASFSWQRATYDYFLTQEGRIQRDLDRETYVRRLAAAGFSHLEINGLASPMGLESGPKGETYPMFYTYCPALDQFVYSRLNKGLYPFHYLSANLRYLKENARLARKYGLVPGLLCFEPRSVPEAFFDRYPMLRGARVDHPFRSFKPRYTMTTSHPRVLEHYQEMLHKLIQEVPELGFIDIWTNDSGAGFEHTQSLYVGRNGGPYLVREWKDSREIARVAGDNVLRFLETLKEAGREANPDFRVITRLESFYGEHDTVWQGLGNGLDVETASLIGRGWDMPYSHPRYADSHAINGGSIYQTRYDEQERVLLEELAERGGDAHFFFNAGPNIVFAPLLGVPYPRLTLERLKLLHQGGVRHLAQLGGSFPPEKVPFNVNHEVLNAFQYDSDLDGEGEIQRLARAWAGERLGQTLCEAWKNAEEAILAFPHVTPLYNTIGFTWYRLWIRPLVPDMEAIPRAERAYYEDFMCTTPHNPNNVDLSRDVLFQLCTAESCAKALERIDQHLWEPIDRAIEILDAVREEAGHTLGEGNVIEDQRIRLQALRCWFRTQRNVAAWIVAVHGYQQQAEDSLLGLLREAIDQEIDNSRALLALVGSGVEFMAITDQGETPLIHGDNLEELLRKRIELMGKHRQDPPFIDPNYIEKKAGADPTS